jgi:hypothetical protein
VRLAVEDPRGLLDRQSRRRMTQQRQESILVLSHFGVLLKSDALHDGLPDFHPLAKAPRDFGERVVVKLIRADANRRAERRGLVDPRDLRDDLLLLTIPDVEIGAVGELPMAEKFVDGLLGRVRVGDAARAGKRGSGAERSDREGGSRVCRYVARSL